MSVDNTDRGDNLNVMRCETPYYSSLLDGFDARWDKNDSNEDLIELSCYFCIYFYTDGEDSDAAFQKIYNLTKGNTELVDRYTKWAEGVSMCEWEEDEISLDDVFINEKVSLVDNKFINKENKAGIDMKLIGLKNDKLVFVGLYDWQIYEISFTEISNIGKLFGATLYDVTHDPNIILKEAKTMSKKEIEQALGHKVILNDRRY